MNGRENPHRASDLPSTWLRASGFFLRWTNNAVVEEARRAWTTDGRVAFIGPTGVERTSVLWRFEATALPWQLQINAVEHAGRDDGRREIRVEEGRWWARWGDRVRSGDASAGESIGTDGLELMLRPPGDVLELLGPCTATRYARGGNELVDYTGALPDLTRDRSRFEEATFALGEWIVLGTDSFRLTVDQTTGVVVSWQADVRGIPASGGELSGLSFS